MGISDFLFGKEKVKKRLWATSEKTITSTESEFGKTKIKTDETITERDSKGNTISKTTTTKQTED